MALGAIVNTKRQFGASVLFWPRMPADALPTLQARKQQLVRDAIWDAALDRFEQKGFDETTVEDIAEAAGVSRRSFFRYFASKSDLMAHGIVNYVDLLAETIDECPESASLAEVFRQTVLRVAEHSAAYPRTRRVMQIAAKYPAAREAQVSRLAELQDRVAEAYARRCRRSADKDLAPNVLAGLTLSILAVAFRTWFESGKHDIARCVDEVLATLGHLVCDSATRKR